MFDTLTEAERGELAHKLADWAHNLAVVGHVLASVSLATPDIPDAHMWDESERYYATRADLVDLRAEVLAA